MEDSDEDVEAHPPRTAVLWEKCIEQSFIVDLSEDESLHFSDLEASFPVHLSQAGSAASEASLHLSGTTFFVFSSQIIGVSLLHLNVQSTCRIGVTQVYLIGASISIYLISA